MISVIVNDKEVRDWVRNQPNRDRAKLQMMTAIKNKAVEEVAKEARKHSVRGDLERSVMGTANMNSAEIYSLLYGDIVLEYGRSPGRMPPIKPMEEWAGRVLGKPELGYVIARNIARRGTQKKRTGRPKQLSQVERRLAERFIPNELTKLLEEFAK